MTEADRSEALQKRLDRERRARREAEAIAERVTGELYGAVGELEKANRDLEAANASIREFVAVASHDIRGPLTVILGMTQILRDDHDSVTAEEREEMLASIDERGRMLNRLVEDLLTVSRLELGAVETHIADISLPVELDRIVHELGDERIVIRNQASDEVKVRADRDHVDRILVNYLTNALKYGEPPVEIVVGCVPEFAEVRVKDHGPGIPDEFVHRLFTKFARADDERARSRPGTGLGLSIVRGLAQANGGDAWYEPNRPRGSCFVVKFPVTEGSAS
jgi:signal transduction histidine kinase